MKDPKRHFIYVETAFFARWWDEQPDARRNLTRTLVANGQLEFINVSTRACLCLWPLVPGADRSGAGRGAGACTMRQAPCTQRWSTRPRA